MINELNNLIMQAMKEHNTIRTETLRAIKTAFMNWETSKEHAGQEMTEVDEIQILKKMVKQREESANMYQLAHRQDLVDKEIEEVNIIKGFLPAEIDDYIFIKELKNISNPQPDKTDWNQVRINAAISVLNALLETTNHNHSVLGKFAIKDTFIESAVEYADKLVYELKRGEAYFEEKLKEI